MEDLLEIFKLSDSLDKCLEEHQQDMLQKLRLILYGPELIAAAAPALPREQLLIASPQQTIKRAKRLSSLCEEQEQNKNETSEQTISARSSNSLLLAKVSIMEQDVQEPPAPKPAPQEQEKQVAIEEAAQEHEFVRPKRAAKLKSEKNLKEMSAKIKLRRPSNFGVSIKQEHEQRQSQMLNTSSASERSKQSTASAKSDVSLLVVPEKVSIVELLSENEGESEEKQEAEKTDGLEEPARLSEERMLRVLVKREKLSGDALVPVSLPVPVPDNDATIEAIIKFPKPKKVPIKTEPTACEDSTLNPNTTSTTNSTVNASTAGPQKKKGRKKKDVEHRPIKVERFSDIDKPSPISSRTRHGSVGRSSRTASIYEDAVDKPVAELNQAAHADTPPTRVSQVPEEVMAAAIAANSPTVNETVSMPNATMNQPNATFAANDATFTAPNPAQTTFQVAAGQTTFVMENPNATVTITAKQSSEASESDTTFNVAAQSNSLSKDNQSMVTAKDSSNPADDSLITEDESYKSPQLLLPPPPPQAPKQTALKAPTSAKSYKMPLRANELFNPLVQSPVKKKVEAFEAVAVQQAKPGRPKRTKENLLPTTQSSSTTPTIGKSIAPVLGRFLTPTQGSNITPNATLQTKKLASSASKAMPFPKANTSSLKAGGSSSAKATLSRENSGDDFRRGIHQLAEDRKKFREQKHLLAAQQREAKEKERAERMAKLAKERNEKRLKRQAELDQKKKAMEDIQLKLRQQEEQEKLKLANTQSAKAKAIQEQERDLLQQMKPPKSKQFVQPAPKSRSKYTFEMLHEDDSTDDEEKISYKRPPPPSWSRSTVRGPSIHKQQTYPTDVIDCFFSVQPMTPDLKLIFPNIDERHLKRNSSAFWSTPPRYSELPKY